MDVSFLQAKYITLSNVGRTSSTLSYVRLFFAGVRVLGVIICVADADI